MVVRSDYVSRHAELADEIERCRFGGEKAVRPGLKQAAVQTICLDDAAHAWTRFEDDAFAAVLGEIVGGRKSGNATADDEGARRHGVPGTADSPQRHGGTEEKKTYTESAQRRRRSQRMRGWNVWIPETACSPQRHG